ncbi:MAG: SDR family NAD(P)-dependent oxidoreductase, partial [Planctomycetaceae bacterium]|nr:SDR family NAD(P)-dependent oxidoreductase [Planctomycetaceae bacterium]
MATTRTALITGAASGIGAEIAQTLFREGCHVVIADRKEPEYLKSLSAADQQTRFIPTDLSQQAECQSL